MGVNEIVLPSLKKFGKFNLYSFYTHMSYAICYKDDNHQNQKYINYNLQGML